MLELYTVESLTEFYNKWHRPDLQAIIVSGDIEVDDIEKHIKKSLSKIPINKEIVNKEDIVIEPYKEDKVCIIKDNTSQSYNLEIIIPSNVLNIKEIGSIESFKKDIIYSILTSIINKRFKTIDTPACKLASITYSNRSTNNIDTYINISTKRDAQEGALEDVMQEVKRIKEFGITEKELKTEIELKRKVLEKKVAYKDIINNSIISHKVMDNFSYNIPIIDAQTYSDITNNILDSLTLNTTNSFIYKLIPDTKVAIIYQYSMAFLPPKEENMLNSYKKGLNCIVEPISEGDLPETLLDTTKIKKIPIKNSYTDSIGN